MQFFVCREIGVDDDKDYAVALVGVLLEVWQLRRVVSQQKKRDSWSMGIFCLGDRSWKPQSWEQVWRVA